MGKKISAAAHRCLHKSAPRQMTGFICAFMLLSYYGSGSSARTEQPPSKRQVAGSNPARSVRASAAHVQDRVANSPEGHLGAVVVIAHRLGVDAQAVVRDLQVVDVRLAVFA